MQIDRSRALSAFKNYISAYDPTNPRIALKVSHTYRVAQICDKLARSLGMCEPDVDLAWLCGLLHDVGRFEQIRRYNTFMDSKSESHALLGAKVLFENEQLGHTIPGKAGSIRNYVLDTSEDELLYQAVALHSCYQLPDNLDARTRHFCELLRDADKIDILKVNCIESIWDIYGVTDNQMSESPVTNAVVSTFYAHKTVPSAIRRHPADMLVGHICFVWGLAFRQSLEEVVRQGYVFQMLEHPFQNHETAQAFARMEQHLVSWLATQGIEVSR